MPWIPETWSQILLLLWTGLVLTLQECPEDLDQFTREAEVCLQPLFKTSNITLMGGLTDTLREEHCGLYRTSLDCLHRLMNLCPEHNHLPYREPLREGIGKLCEDDNTFRLYRAHSSCFWKHHERSMQCLVDFTHTIRALSDIMENEDSYFDDSMVCRAYNELLDCVYVELEPQCGKEASLLYEELVKAQVPAEVAAMCRVSFYPNDDEYDDAFRSGFTTPSSSGANIGTIVEITSLLYLLFAILTGLACHVS